MKREKNGRKTKPRKRQTFFVLKSAQYRLWLEEGPSSEKSDYHTVFCNIIISGSNFRAIYL